MDRSAVNPVEKHRARTASAFGHIWKNPETGCKEWKVHTYLTRQLETPGDQLQTAGSIPRLLC